MHAKNVNAVRIHHKYLDENYYIDPTPPTMYMSNEGATKTAHETIKWTLKHLNARSTHAFDDGIDTEMFFNYFRKMLDVNLSSYLLETKPDPCPYTNDELFEEADYALDKVFPTDAEIKNMPDTIDTPEYLLRLIITGIERVYSTMMNRGCKAEPHKPTVTLTVEA